MIDPAPQVTSLLSNRDLDRLARLRLNVSRRFTNRARGEHLAAKGGASTEFCDYRDYAPGDDVRFVDWNIFARIQRPYLKQYHHEEELHVAIIVDASQSMHFEGKLALAQQLTAALAVMSLRGNEKVSVFASGPGARLTPRRGRGAQGQIFHYLENIQAGGAQTIDQGIEAFLRQHRGRGVAIILSDFLTETDLARPFNLLFNAGLQVFGIQILSPAELDPEVAGDLRFVDCETATHLDISSAGALLSIYHEYRRSHEARISALCQQRAGRFLPVSSADTLETVLFGAMRRQGWVI